MTNDDKIKVKHHRPDDVTATEIKSQAGEVFKKIPLLGPISWLYSQSKAHQYYFLNDISWLVMPALMNDQYKLFIKDDAPLAYVSWAKLNHDIIERIKKSNQLRLAPQEWIGGDIVLIVDAVVPFGGMQNVVKTVRDSEFADQDVYMFMPAMPGKDEGKIVKLPEAQMPETDENKASDDSLH